MILTRQTRRLANDDARSAGGQCFFQASRRPTKSITTSGLLNARRALMRKLQLSNSAERTMRPSLILGTKKRTRKKRKPGERTEANAAFKRAYEQLFGSQGAASPVRKIDPVTGQVIAVIKPD